MRRHNLAVGLIGIAVALAACGTGGDLPKLPGAAAATGERSMAGAADTSMMVANIRYELADGLTTDITTGKAYNFADASESDVEKLANAFGVKGAIHRDGESWSVGGSDKAESSGQDGAYLYVTRNGGVFSMSVNYASSGSGTSGCAVAPVAPDTPVASDQDVVRCDPPTPSPTTIPANAPTPEGAKKVAADALKAAGVDVDGAKVSVESYDGATQNVRFQHTVDGKPVDGYESYVGVGPEDKIISASGYLVQPASVGTYELATLTRAVERLNESFSNTTTLEARDDVAVAPARGEPEPDPAVMQEPEPSGEPRVVTLTKVTVGLMLQSDYDGDLWLVPAYRFTSDDGNPVTAQAADDKYIEQPPVTTEPKVDPGATEPGGGSSSPGSEGSCEAVEGELSAQVCASNTTVKVGERVVFRITATDADRGFAAGCFDGVTAVYGDDSGGDVRCEACSMDVAPGPGKLGVERSHTYDKPGTYTATFTVRSGADCASDPKDSEAKVSLKISVA